jgi:ABC-2 type transport system permease protein
VNKIWVIAHREFVATVRTRAFVIGIVMMPIMKTLGGVVGAISRRIDDQGERSFVVVDRTPGAQIFPILETAVARRNKQDVLDRKTGVRNAPLFKLLKVEPEEKLDEQRLALSDRVRKGEISGFLEIGPKALNVGPSLTDLVGRFNSLLPGGFLKAISGPWLTDLVGGSGKPGTVGEKPIDPLRDPATTRYQTRPSTPGAMEFYRFAAIEISLATRMGLASQSPEVRKAVLEQKVPVVMLGLSSRDPDTGKVMDDEGAGRGLARIFVGLGCIMLMFVIIFAVATPLMQGVLEEKMQRISEVLLGSVTPFELMAGKLLGGVGVALTLTLVYVGGAYAALRYYGYSDQVPPSLIAWFLFYQTLALLIYGSLFMAIGAACTDMKEPQTLLLPVMMPAMLPLFLLIPIMNSPDGVLARTAAFFPPCTPMLMLARQALSANVLWWEPVLGSLLVLAFTALCVWIAGRIFRVGILVQGKGATFGQLVGWVFRGE